MPTASHSFAGFLESRYAHLLARCREAGVPFYDDAGVAEQLQRVLLASDFAYDCFSRDPGLLAPDALMLMSDPRPADARVWQVDAGERDEARQMALLRRFRPEILIVYPNNLAAFAAIWESEGFDLKSLRHIKTIGETVHADLRDRVRVITGLPIEDYYSSQEVGPIAIECPASGLYHVMSEALIVEVVDAQGAPCREGETGRVLVSDLSNLATPLIRYDIGDYAEVGPACSCGPTSRSAAWSTGRSCPGRCRPGRHPRRFTRSWTA